MTPLRKDGPSLPGLETKQEDQELFVKLHQNTKPEAAAIHGLLNYHNGKVTGVGWQLLSLSRKIRSVAELSSTERLYFT